MVCDALLDPARFEAGAVLHPGARVEGPRTLVGRGARIGTAGPAVVRNCAVGRGVELGSGVFEDAVFFDGASAGPSCHIRGGTLFEEHARAGHAVGTKQTILMPFVTLGSLINFCDCLMAGGTGEADHGEVGSGFIHFNFTPSGDKATPSVFGDVARGAFLREPRIFLGGHSGVVGPIRVGFGTVLAAGAVFRKDCGEGVLVLGESAPAKTRAVESGVVRGAAAKVRKNLEYIADLEALRAFHREVRLRLCGSDAHRRALVEAAVALLGDSISERVRQLDRFGALLASSGAKLGTVAENAAEARWQTGFAEQFAEGRAAYLRVSSDPASNPDLTMLLATIPESGADHVAWVRGLSNERVASGTAWLSAVKDRALAPWRVAGLLPALGSVTPPRS